MRRDSVAGPSSPVRRLHARLAGWRLDRRLAAGADPRGDELLGCRAEQLVKPTYRHLIADGLRAALARANWAGPLGSVVPVARSSVRMYADELLALAARLDSDGPVQARGVARARLLLLDGASPLYRPASPLKLHSALDRAWIGLGD
jgi:hypothetical protein